MRGVGHGLDLVGAEKQPAVGEEDRIWLGDGFLPLGEPRGPRGIERGPCGDVETFQIPRIFAGEIARRGKAPREDEGNVAERVVPAICIL